MVRKFTGDGNRLANKILFRIPKVTACGEYDECSMTEVGALYFMLLFVFIALTVVNMYK